jgi:tRNA G18 (ribose-2'-O)-methylase SpoU
MVEPGEPTGTGAERGSVRSSDDPLAVRIARAAEGEHRNVNEFLIENEPNIRGALAAGVELRHVLVAPRLAEHPLVRDLLGDIPVSVVDDELLGQLFSRTRAPELFALAGLPDKRRFRSFASTTGDIVVLDGIDGPGNIGSIIRIATAFEAGGIVQLNRQHRETYRRGIVRASAGTMFSLPIVAAKTTELLRFCEASGTRLVATSSHASEASFDEVMASPERLAIVLGSESRGCSPEIEAAADVRCRIPMSSGVESLNVSAAAAVLLFSRFRSVPPDR